MNRIANALVPARRKRRTRLAKSKSTRIRTYNSRYPAFSNNLRPGRVPYLPTETTFTYRMTLSRIISAGAGTNGIHFAINVTRPLVGQGNDANTPGGFLSQFYNYDRAVVIGAALTMRVQNMGIFTHNAQPSVRVVDVADGANMLAAFVPANMLGALANANQDTYERLKDIPTTQARQIGSYQGGHDAAKIKLRVDVEKYSTQTPNFDQWIYRNAQNEVTFPDLQGALASGMPALYVMLVTSHTIRPAQRQDFLYEFEFDFQIRFHGLRMLPKLPGDLVPLTIAAPAAREEAGRWSTPELINVFEHNPDE